MAENINISFAPNKTASDSQRITDLEQYVSTLTERTKFVFASIIEDYGLNTSSDDKTQIYNMMYQIACEAVSVGVPCGDGSSVWFNILTDSDKPGTSVDPSVSYSCIGGRLNEAHNQCYAVGIIGESNVAYGCSFSSICGQNNTVGGDMYSVVAGMHNTASHTTRCIISGNSNYVEFSDSSVVSGQQNTVNGNFSAVIANNAEVSGNDDIVIGEKHTVSGNMNAVFGNNNIIKGNKNIASGDCNNVTDNNSVVLGTSNTAKNGSSYIVGGSNEVSGMNFVYGYWNTANGAHNILIGENLKADNSNDINGYSQIAIGTYMDTEQLENYDGKWRFVIADGNYDNPHNLIYAIEDVEGKRKLYFGCDIDLPSASDTTLGAVKIGENISLSADGTISVDLSSYLKSAEISDWAKADGKPAYTADEIGLGNVDNTADKDKPISSAMQAALDGKADVSHKHTISDITDMPEYLTEETDPTVPAWAKQAEKPVYTADEVGAAAEQHKHSTADITDFPAIPTKVSDLQNDSGYISEETDPTVPAWAKADEKPSYTAEEVGAAAKKHTHTKSEITDFPTLGTAAGKNIDYFAAAEHTHTATDVGAATAADITAAVNAISIGGRNIVTGTADVVIGYGGHSKGHWRKYGTAGTIQTVDITNTPISCVSKGIRLTSTAENSQIICGQDDIPLNSGMIYTFSCWIRSNSAEGVPCRLQPFYKSTTDHSGNTQDIIISDEWQYISFTAKFSPQSTGTYSGARIYLQSTAVGNYIEVCAMKFEAGNKPTDWSPAPEDAERRITALEARVAALEAATVSGGEV